MSAPSIHDLHDATLKAVKFDWESGELTLKVRTHKGDATFCFQDVIQLEIPRRHSWGPSTSINEVVDSIDRCEIEMQSGDTILILKKPKDY